MATTPVFLPGKPHGQRRLVGYSPCVIKRQTRLEQVSMHTCIHALNTPLSRLSRWEWG